MTETEDTATDTADNSVATSVSTVADNSVMAGRNGGSLRRGNPGNKGGAGRPPKAVQSRSRQLYDRVLDALDERLDHANTLELDELVSVGGLAGRYAGLGDDKALVQISVASLHLDALRQPRHALATMSVSTNDVEDSE